VNRPLPALCSSRSAALLLAALLAGSACGSPASSDGPAAAPATASTVVESPAGEAAVGVAADGANRPAAALSELVTELPPAPVGFPQPEPEGPRPAALSIAALGVDGASVIDVGVEPDGDMEVPPADRVGWYRYGPAPGQDGSAVLAAHIAFDGRNGVFVRLADLQPGAEVVVTYDDGTTDRFVVESNQRYDKDELPDDLVYARSGPSRLVLITCGGRFDSNARSYEDNVVVVATPVGGS
jgi:hypothetical protein